MAKRKRHRKKKVNMRNQDINSTRETSKLLSNIERRFDKVISEWKSSGKSFDASYLLKLTAAEIAYSQYMRALEEIMAYDMDINILYEKYSTAIVEKQSIVKFQETEKILTTK